jgi:subtilisin family serine protease
MIAAGMVVAAPAGVAAPSAVAAPDVVPAGTTVTLLTGDEVTLSGSRVVNVLPAAGREHVAFFTDTDENGDVNVVPEDAAAMMSQGKLDPRLFDVTGLVKAGYDDAKRGTLPIIVDYEGPTPRSAAVKASRELPVLSATAMSVDRSGAYWQTARKAEHVWLDGPVKATLDQSVPQIGAPEAWNAGYTGEGATVAVLDTGIDATHPDLSDAIAGAQNFTDSDTTDDRAGHGTHVASIITGNGAASGGKYQGVAPDAQLLNGKVLNDSGGGLDSWIIAGMEWAARNGADVINMSLGSFTPSDGTDPMSQAVNRITAETGTLFVISSGNEGPTAGFMGSPGAADAALTVGAVDGNDELAEFSSRGPRMGDNAIKPDITAPGVNIVAAKAANGWMGDPAADGYVSMSGTSMAAPHVAGAAAIVAAQHPDWTPEQLKGALMGTAKPDDTRSVFEQGAGRVDVAKATTAAVLTSPGSVSFGLEQWPHTDDKPIAKTLTYTNTGSAPVTLDLAAEATGEDGSAAAQGMFTVSPAQVTVPAGGQATATVTSDTTVNGPDGVYTGAVTATGGGQTVRTPFAVTKEVESYNVTMRAIDQSGAPTSNYRYRFVMIARPDKYHRSVYKPLPGEEVQAVTTLRLPKGEYFYSGVVQTQVSDTDYHNATIAEPAFVLDRDTELVFDAREAKPLSLTVDEPTAKPVFSFVNFLRDTAVGMLGESTYWPNDGSLTVKPSTTRSDAFTFDVESMLAKWNGESFDNSPYLYHVRFDDHVVPQSLDWRVLTRDLAKVRAEHAATMPGTYGMREAGIRVPLPGTMTEYYTPDVPWRDNGLAEVREDTGEMVSFSSQLEPVTYRRGRTTTVRWGVGVFGPSLLSGPAAITYAGRYQDTLWVSMPMVTDQGSGRVGYMAGNGTTTLLRNGEVISEQQVPVDTGWVNVGPERAAYTLRMSSDRSAFAGLSTQINAEWTFTSEHTEGTDPIPLVGLRFAPNLDDHNNAPAGKRFSFPVRVERIGSTDANLAGAPVVEASYDDGKTWCPVKLTGSGADWKATVDHPKGARFVSLRSSVTGTDGFTQHLTIIRAYALA